MNNLGITVKPILIEWAIPWEPQYKLGSAVETRYRGA